MNFLHRIVARPAVYDVVQKLCGCELSMHRIRELAADPAGITVLDVGAGTGNGLRALPPKARYLWLDNDPLKLTGLRVKGRTVMAVLGSATAMPLRSKSVDTALCIAMSHHLDDREVLDLFAELARVCRNRLVFVDPVECPKSLVSRLLWMCDRGSHPRPAAVLRGLVQQRFAIESEEEYAIYHHYWICAARPLDSVI